MSESCQLKNINVECFITDDGKLYIDLLDQCDMGIATFEAKLINGKLPWRSYGW